MRLIEAKNNNNIRKLLELNIISSKLMLWKTIRRIYIKISNFVS